MALQLAGSRFSIAVPSQAGPTTPVTIGCEPSATPAGPPDPREIDLRVQKAIDEVLEYHRTHRPKNTSKNYLPKQKEWMNWCTTMNFRPGGDHLPWDWVDEGKLLLFIKEEVAARPPRKGSRVKAEKKRKATAKLAKCEKKRVKSTAKGGELEDEEHKDNGGDNDDRIFEGDDDGDCSELLLTYNSVRGYVSAINELWAHQTSKGLHNAPQPQRVAIKALQTSIIRGQHQRRRDEFTDRGLGTIKDGYTASQIPDLTNKVWMRSLGEHATEQHFRPDLG